eukprot:gnl/MRDRNA2_/MRDRNA2_77183_c0_seq1.p1 gnl/MRDRNA2_/MRDRNA2_77183_c0~~gnl/MRDRNA2_/MRDRNA2_77183_c0_seq1.p1  ORF type:complete len:108 (+),score=33.89 gnl/MRDRNA2_/MRDRNA2_77183_c0_seq1:101-424(+)
MQASPQSSEARQWYDIAVAQNHRLKKLQGVSKAQEETVQKLSQRLESTLEMIRDMQKVYGDAERLLAAQQKIIEEDLGLDVSTYQAAAKARLQLSNKGNPTSKKNSG